MAVTKQFIQLDEIHQGTTLADNLKMLDAVPMQHEDLSSGTNKLAHLRFAQVLCNPVATAGNHTGGVYSASVLNFPDFAIKYQDSQQNPHYLVGLKVRVIFNNGITYGSVSGGTYPSLNVGDTEALPLLAQGKTMASGACSAGQTLELTLIPYGNNSYAWDADSNVRESTTDYTIYTDGLITYTVEGVEDYGLGRKIVGTLSNSSYFNFSTDCNFGEYTAIEFWLTIWDEDTYNNIVIHGFYLRDNIMREQVVAKDGMDKTGENIYGTLVISGLNQTANKNKFECYIKNV